MTSNQKQNLCLGLLLMAALGFLGAAIMIDERPEFAVAASPAILRLGTLEQNTEHLCTGKLVNTGKTPMIIQKTWSSCGCSEVKISEQRIEVGGNIDYSVTLKTGKSDEESITRLIFVEIANPDGTEYQTITIPIEYSSRMTGRPI